MQYEPKFEGEIEGYSVKKVVSSLWRFAGSHDVDDLLQECYVVFLKCEKWYYEKCDMDKRNASVFMGYYKASLHNQLNDLSITKKHPRGFSQHSEDFYEYSGEEDDHLVWSMLVEQAPSEVSEVLRIILKSPKEVFEALGLHNKFARWSNSRFCKLLGISDKNNIIMELKNYLFRNIVKEF